MKLKYKILWIEDKEEYYESIRDDIISYVNSFGFDIDENDITYRENESDFKEKNYEDYDMMLIDWELGSERGSNIINDIRKSDIYNEIIFYSQDGSKKLREVIAKKQIEGVFCSGRKELVETFEKIFEVNMRKVLDLNNLRGLVMAEVSDLDELKTEILKLAYEKKVINENFFNENIFPLVINWYWKKLVEIKRFAGVKVNRNYTKERKKYPSQNVSKFLNGFLFSLDFKIDSIEALINKSNLKCDFNKNNYKKDIQQKRNKLAHVVEEWKEIEGKKVQILKNTEFEFNRDEVKKIFEDIKKYKEALNILKSEINSLKIEEGLNVK